jgi:hypothetical protein
VVLLLVLYGHETLSLTSKGVYILRVSEKKVLRRISESKRDEEGG